MTKNVSATPEDLAAVALGMKCLFVAVLIFGIALPTALLIWQSVTPDMVIKRAVAGQFVFASTGSGFLQPSTTTVTTAQGSLIVVGLFSAPRNQPLEVVQWSQKSGLELCAVGRSDTCLPMAGSWAGTLQPTRAQAFDFQKHGLGSDHLTLWLLVGFSLSLMTGVGWFSAHRDAEKLARGSRAPPAIGGSRTPDASSDLLRSCPSSLASRLPQPPPTAFRDQEPRSHDRYELSHTITHLPQCN